MHMESNIINMKYDIHLHLTLNQLPKQEEMFISSAENMLGHLEKLGIEKGLLMSSGEGRTSPVMTNNECIEICKKSPDKFSWFCNLDYMNEDKIKERLLLYKSQGALGIGEFVINKWLDNSFIQSVFKAAEELSMPILIHMSPMEDYNYGVADRAGLPLLEEALNKYPRLKIIGHSQPFWHEISKDAETDIESRNKWGEGKVVKYGRLIELLNKYPNLYADLSANSGGHAIMRDEEFGLWFLNEYKDRLMFGTDMVNTDMVFPLGKWLDNKLIEGSVKEEVYIKLVRDNAREILGM